MRKLFITVIILLPFLFIYLFNCTQDYYPTVKVTNLSTSNLSYVYVGTTLFKNVDADEESETKIFKPGEYKISGSMTIDSNTDDVDVGEHTLYAYKDYVIVVKSDSIEVVEQNKPY